MRIFEYPCEKSGHYRVFAHHFNEPIRTRLSSNGRLLLTGSVIDG